METLELVQEPAQGLNSPQTILEPMRRGKLVVTQNGALLISFGDPFLRSSGSYKHFSERASFVPFRALWLGLYVVRLCDKLRASVIS